MKIKMFYMKGMRAKARAIGHETDPENRYNRYVGGFLWSELSSPQMCQMFLRAMDEIAEQGGDAEETFNDKAWGADIRPATVEIWSTMRDDWVDTFSHNEIRRAVEGWMKLLQMPDSPESQIIVDLGGEK
ncbi:MAG: hypothetical protein ACYC67_26940 [Prosthecobacter sp.]